MHAVPTTVVVEIEAQFDEAVELARALAEEATVEEARWRHRDKAALDAYIMQARKVCAALGIWYWKGA